MKVMIVNDCPTAPYFIRMGWVKAILAANHQVYFWDSNREPAFDAFNRFNPDVFIGTTYGVTNAVDKCIRARPKMKVALFCGCWGQYTVDLDRNIYPVDVPSQEEIDRLAKLKEDTNKPDFVFIHYHDKDIAYTLGGWATIGIPPFGIMNGADTFDYLGGKHRKEFECDIGFIGGYWPYKARNLDKYLIRLYNEGKFKIKIFGNGRWPVPCYLGALSQFDAKDFFASSKICLNISEPHSVDHGFDIIERPFKTMLNGFTLSDKVEANKLVFKHLPEYTDYDNFEEKINYYLEPSISKDIHMVQKQDILENHTYFHRMEKLFRLLNIDSGIMDAGVKLGLAKYNGKII